MGPERPAACFQGTSLVASGSISLPRKQPTLIRVGGLTRRDPPRSRTMTTFCRWAVACMQARRGTARHLYPAAAYLIILASTLLKTLFLRDKGRGGSTAKATAARAPARGGAGRGALSISPEPRQAITGTRHSRSRRPLQVEQGKGQGGEGATLKWGGHWGWASALKWPLLPFLDLSPPPACRPPASPPRRRPTQPEQLDIMTLLHS